MNRSADGPARAPAAGWAWAALLLAAWVAALGLAPLFNVDEGAFAEASREMLASGDWGHTTLNGADRFDKPILVYWLQAASLWLFGLNEFAARLPSALCAWGWCLAAGQFARQRWGGRVGLAASGLLATSLGPMLIGRAATADALLNLLLVLTLFDLWRAVQGERAAVGRAFLWAALGLLAKGPVAVVVPVGALAVWAVASRQPGRWLALGRLVMQPRAWMLGVAVAVPWYAYALWRHGQAFIDGFLLRHNVDRFAGPLEGHRGGFGYYLVMLPVLMLPWAPLLVALAAQAWRRWRAGPPVSEDTRFLLAWTGFVLGFFSLSGTKLPHYVLYGFTPLAVLGGRWLADAVPSGRIVVAVTALCVALVALGAGSPALAVWAAERWGDAHWRAVLSPQSLPVAPGLAVTAAGIAAVLVAAAWSLRAGQRSQRGGWGLLAAAGVALLWVSLVVVPWWGQTLHGPVRTLAERARSEGWPLVQWNLHEPSAGFYRQQPTLLRAPLPGEAALVRADRLDRQRAELPDAAVVARAPGYVLVRRPEAAK